MDSLVILIIVLIVVLIWRGPKTLPQIGAMLGRGVRGARQEAEKLRATGGPTEPTDPDHPAAG
ncbi:MAG TPA: twin-arginine translocase TatA/TatE family subunit [Candidatus Eisenbacteria bacterium]|nr:twin-arginine translocase TatA/TatE family subunit [Candidatus Eisenbacteria bacterium]